MTKFKSPLTFFTDRCLNSPIIINGLREAGLHIIEMDDYYGKYAAENVSDEVWLEVVGSQGWIALTKDTKIHKKSRERDTVLNHHVRGFYLTQPHLSAAISLARWLHHKSAIEATCQSSGPFWYAVQADQIVRVL